MYNEPEYDVEEKIKLDKEKTRAKKKVDLPAGEDDFEKCKVILTKTQNNEYEDPDNHYCEINIPSKVKLGDDLVIKLSNNALNIHYVLGDGFEWKRKEKFDPKSDYHIQLRPTVDKKEHDKNSITIPIGLVQTINKKEYQMWLSGYYYIEIRAYGDEWHEDTVASRMIKIE
mgnify:CR=1 FL=1